MGNETFTDETAERLKGGKKVYKLTTGRGFYILVTPRGAKSWRWDFQHGKSRGTINLGKFPEVSIDEAEKRKKFYLEQHQNNIDPRLVNKLERSITGKVQVKIRGEQPGDRTLLVMNPNGDIILQFWDYTHPPAQAERIPIPSAEIFFGRITNMVESLNKLRDED